jgi:hypothetical protein
MPLTLTAPQLQTLAAAITADGVLNALPKEYASSQQVADAFNAAASPDYWVWSTSVDVGTIYDAVNWANFTPNDAADNTVTYQNRSMLVQIKQVNLQLILQGRDTLNASRANVRNGLSDATQNLPTGNNGNVRTAGWAGIVAALRRRATRAEKLYAVAATGAGNDGIVLNRGTTTNPDNLTYQGAITYEDVLASWGL